MAVTSFAHTDGEAPHLAQSEGRPPQALVFQIHHFSHTSNWPMAESTIRTDALNAWDAAGLTNNAQGQVHVVSLKPLLSQFFENVRDPAPGRAAAAAALE